MAHGEFAHVAVDEVEAHGEDNVDADVHEDELDVLVHEVRSRDEEESPKPAARRARPMPLILKGSRRKAAAPS